MSIALRRIALLDMKTSNLTTRGRILEFFEAEKELELKWKLNEPQMLFDRRTIIL